MIGNNISDTNMRIHANDANRNSRGFTLIELLVAVAVFSTMVTVVSTIFISSVGSQRKNVGQQDVLDNARYILESMGRTIRQSSIITGDGSGQTLTLSHPTKGTIIYDLNNNQIIESLNPGSALALSSSNVYVSRLNFGVSGNGSIDNTQPRVTISISLRNVGNQEDEQSYINLQTTITPRNLQSQF